MGAVRDLARPGRAHVVLDRALGGPPALPAHGRRRAVRRRRPATDPARRRDADRDRSPRARDGRHGCPPPRRRRVRRDRGQPDRQQRERLLGDERGAGGQQRRDLHCHGQDRGQRRAAGEWNGKGRRTAREPPRDRRRQRFGVVPRGRARRPDPGARRASPRRRGRGGEVAARRPRGGAARRPDRSRSWPSSPSRSPPSSTSSSRSRRRPTCSP